ncbi:MAG: hypothetical protein AB7P00_07535 [Sandaracinaceae bacterium]
MTPLDAARDAGGEDAAVADGGDRDGGGADAGGDAGDVPPTSCLSASVRAGGGPTDALDDASGRASVTIDDPSACTRAYMLMSTAALRDGQPENPRTIYERTGQSTLRTGHALFDALYALAIEEARQNSVAAIRDGAFNDGNAVDCGADGCFETGRLWHYAWTRDSAFSSYLGLAAFDPSRMRGTLEFKLSERRGGSGLEIVQDTGSGGSYPVSTDRVAWALGASALLDLLQGTERDAFASRAREALRNTVERDRAVVFDARDGLYRGETSFLDWREQTYPEWTATDVVHLAMSKSLSTNLLHLVAIELAARLHREAGDTTDADRYDGWATALRTAIGDRFWLEEDGLFSSYTTTELDPAPVHRYDLLGSALAVITGVASASQADRVLASYPHVGHGAPVVFPEQQRTAIYHNRAEWPFVSAFWLRAASVADSPAVADRMVTTLMRGAALNLSNMENLEAASGLPYVDDGAYSGPVVNSQRQLWSVAGYLSMVQHTLFGLSPTEAGLRVSPYLSGALADELFASSDTIVLNGFGYLGHTVSVVLHLPAERGVGALVAERRELNGAALDAEVIATSQLAAANRVDVYLTTGAASAPSLTVVDDSDWHRVFGPRTPRVDSVTNVGGHPQLALALADPSEASSVTWSIYRDGVEVADGLTGTTTSWTDASFDANGPRTPCYSAELTFTAGGTRSQHAAPSCYWGPSSARVTTIDASAMAHSGGSASTSHGRFHYEPWGEPGDSLTVTSFTPSQSGPHLLQVTFGNGAGGVTTGITCALKRLVVEEIATGAVIAEGPLVMPHLGDWDRWVGSNFVRADLTAGRAYRITIRSEDEMANMSAFAHFDAYTGGLGGRSGAFNRANIAELKILAL